MFMTNWNCDARLWQFEIGGKTLKLMKQSRLLAGDTLQRANTSQTRFHAHMYEQKQEHRVLTHLQGRLSGSLNMLR